MDGVPLIINFKQEKLTPEREIAKDELEPALDVLKNKVESEDKKEIEPSK